MPALLHRRVTVMRLAMSNDEAIAVRKAKHPKLHLCNNHKSPAKQKFGGTTKRVRIYVPIKPRLITPRQIGTVHLGLSGNG